MRASVAGTTKVTGLFADNFQTIFHIKYLFERFLLTSGYPYPTRNPTRPRVKSPALTVALLQNLRSSCCSSFRSLKCKYMLPRRNTSSLHTESFILIMNKHITKSNIKVANNNSLATHVKQNTKFKLRKVARAQQKCIQGNH